MDRKFAEIAAALGLPDFQPGWVWLVGAGPGDPGLITALGLHAIAQADFILYDALVDETLLKLARPGVGLIFAGKRAGVRSLQAGTTFPTCWSTWRGKGNRVLRLKGGDPFVFGRGGEEAQELARGRHSRSASCRASPRASAAWPMPAFPSPIATPTMPSPSSPAMAPTANCRSMTGRRLAKGSPTLVLYMARKHAGEIADALIAAGRDSRTSPPPSSPMPRAPTRGHRHHAGRTWARRPSKAPPSPSS